jgi:hypothetical protein
MELGVVLVLSVGVFMSVAASLVVLFVALKTKETTDIILSEMRRARSG